MGKLINRIPGSVNQNIVLQKLIILRPFYIGLSVHNF